MAATNFFLTLILSTNVAVALKLSAEQEYAVKEKFGSKMNAEYLEGMLKYAAESNNAQGVSAEAEMEKNMAKVQMAAISQKTDSQQYMDQFNTDRGVCDERIECKQGKGSCWAHVTNDYEVLGVRGLEFDMKVSGYDEYISGSALCEHQTWEWGNTAKILRLMGEPQAAAEKRDGGVFVDVGANIGSFALPILAARPHGRVIGFEVSSSNGKLLEESAQRNGFGDRFELIQTAIVQDPNKKEYCMGATEAELHYNNNMGGNQVNLGDRKFCAEKVKATTLDDEYVENDDMKHVIAMKLDCEGCEAQALYGARKLMSEAPPCFLAIEVTPLYLCQAKTSVVGMAYFLHMHGYDVRELKNSPMAQIGCKDLELKASLGLLDSAQQAFVWVGLKADKLAKCVEERSKYQFEKKKSGLFGEGVTQREADKAMKKRARRFQDHTEGNSQKPTMILLQQQEAIYEEGATHDPKEY